MLTIVANTSNYRIETPPCARLAKRGVLLSLQWSSVAADRRVIYGWRYDGREIGIVH